MDLIERFEQSLKTLSEEDNPMAVEICKLGFPEESELVPTAAVMWDDVHRKIKFIFNDEFQQTLTDEEFTFIIAHEAIHLINNHIGLIKDKLDHMKRFNSTDKEIIKFKKKINIAADCVVNDSLVKLYGFKPIMEAEAKEKPKIVYGKDWVGQSCHDLTVMEVYYMLKDEDLENMAGDSIDEHMWESFFDSNGKMKDGVVKQIKDFIEKNIENSALSDDDIGKIEKIKKEFDKFSKGQKPGLEKLGAYRPIDNLSKVALNWSKIFFQLTERKKPVNIWHQPNRKLISVYPDIIIPSLAQEEKEDIFVAIDSSGSIDYNALSLFVSVIKNVPKSFRVKAISFDTMCYPFDIKSNEQPKGGGGTNFQIIEDWIVANEKKYPKIVIVLTDGCGTFVNPKMPERWCWMLYGYSDTSYCANMKRFNVKDLLL